MAEPSDFSKMLARPARLVARADHAVELPVVPTGVLGPPGELIEQLLADFALTPHDGSAGVRPRGSRASPDRIAVPPWRTRMSIAAPSAGLAVMPEKPSEPPHCRPTLM
jgi:hypothetical protein